MENTDKKANEIWKDVVGYEGYYQVSNLGRVKSVLRKVNHRKWFRTIDERILKQHANKDLHLRMALSKNDNNSKHYYVHRIVAQAFLPNPNNYPIINHKDENPFNNRVDNLEWCTHKYNINYGTRTERANIKRYKKVNQYTLDNKLIKEWESLTAVNDNNCNFLVNGIVRCCKGQVKTYKGFIWRYA